MSISIKPSHKGQLRKDLHIPEGKPISAAELMKALSSSSPAIRKRAQFAKNAKSWNHSK